MLAHIILVYASFILRVMAMAEPSDSLSLPDPNASPSTAPPSAPPTKISKYSIEKAKRTPAAHQAFLRANAERNKKCRDNAKSKRETPVKKVTKYTRAKANRTPSENEKYALHERQRNKLRYWKMTPQQRVNMTKRKYEKQQEAKNAWKELKNADSDRIEKQHTQNDQMQKEEKSHNNHIAQVHNGPHPGRDALESRSSQRPSYDQVGQDSLLSSDDSQIEESVSKQGRLRRKMKYESEEELGLQQIEQWDDKQAVITVKESSIKAVHDNQLSHWQQHKWEDDDLSGSQEYLKDDPIFERISPEINIKIEGV
jgi:hypothetical protein